MLHSQRKPGPFKKTTARDCTALGRLEANRDDRPGSRLGSRLESKRESRRAANRINSGHQREGIPAPLSPVHAFVQSVAGSAKKQKNGGDIQATTKVVDFRSLKSPPPKSR